MNKTNYEMLQIKSLDGDACLRFSDYTNGWYISSRIEVTNRHIIGSVGVQHAETPEEAVHNFLAALKAVEFPKLVVTDSFGANREHWLWNGAAFASQEVSFERV